MFTFACLQFTNKAEMIRSRVYSVLGFIRHIYTFPLFSSTGTALKNGMF